MIAAFGKIKIRPREGRGEGSEGMIEEFISDKDQYEAALETYKENLSESEQ